LRNQPPKPRTIEASLDEPVALPKLVVRDRVAEKQVAKGKQALRLGQLLDDRNTGKLGDEVIKIAQAMLLCTLLYSAHPPAPPQPTTRKFPLSITSIHL